MCKNHSLGWFFVVRFSRGCFNAPGRCYFNIARPDQQRPTGGAAMGGSLRSSLAGCARLPIHIAMGGYASHGRTFARALK